MLGVAQCYGLGLTRAITNPTPGTVEDLRRRHGLTLTPGGTHVGLGTRNHLADLGGGAYLEVIGPDPEQPDTDNPRPFGVDRLSEPRLLTWAVQVQDLDEGGALADTT